MKSNAVDDEDEKDERHSSISIHGLSLCVCVCSCLPVLVWHRLNWTSLFPLVHLDSVDDLTQIAGGYVAGFNDSTITMR